MCDIVVVVKPERVLFGKNSDRDANEAQALEWHPASDHPEGATLRCTWIEIPQVPHTYAILVSRPFWMWGCEMGANEHGVVIGNTAVFTRQPYAKVGLTGMDLVRLALERAATAEEARDVIVSLLETYGQGGGGGYEHPSFTYHNAFILADPTGAVVLETAGKHWTSARVEDVYTLSNGLTLAGFAERHSDVVKTWASGCRHRRRRTLELAGSVEGVADLADLLRDHGVDRTTPAYSWINGGLHAPCVHAGGLLAASQVNGSWISDLTPGRVRHWATATSTPCLSLYKPVAVGSPVDLGPAPGPVMDTRCVWWRFERFQRRVMMDPESLQPPFRRERDQVERAWFASPPDSAEAFGEADRMLGAWSQRLRGAELRDTRPFWVRRYWRRRNRLAGCNPRFA